MIMNINYLTIFIVEVISSNLKTLLINYDFES